MLEKIILLKSILYIYHSIQYICKIYHEIIRSCPIINYLKSA